MPYRRIMAAIDPGIPGEAVVGRAGALSSKLGGTLCVATAVPDLRALYRGTEATLQHGFDRDIVEGTRDSMRDLCGKARVRENEILVLRGDPDHVIADAANDRGVDLVVFGNQDRHGLNHYVGGFGLGLLHRANADLMAVNTHGPTSQPHNPLVAITTDGHETQVLGRARGLFPGANLHILHVVRPGIVDYVFDDSLFPFGAKDKIKTEQALRSVLTPVTNDYGPGELTIKFGTPSTSIETAAQDGGHDIVIMGSGQHSGLGWRVGSTAHNLLSATGVDVLLVRPARNAKA